MADSVKLIIPTSINLLNAVNENFVQQRKASQTLQIDLPSLRRRALLVVNEVGTLPIAQQTTALNPDVRGQ